MTAPQAPTIHASAVLHGARAVLIRGASGSGKSHLALALLRLPAGGSAGFTRLVADDRAHIEASHGRLLVRPAAGLEGLIEHRGLGILRMPYEPLAAVGLVVDLAEAGVERLPSKAAQRAMVAGVTLPRLAVAPGIDALPLVLAAAQGLLAH
jgi:HPr kinase/phosphorylase